MTYYARSAWGAAPPLEPLTPAEPADSLVVHHSAGPAAESPEEAFRLLRGIQAQHQSSGYLDIAYNLAVDSQGNLYEARGMANLGAATYGENDHTRAVVWLGDSTHYPAPDITLRAIAALYVSELGANLLAGASITGHRDWLATACPGAHLYADLDKIRRYTLEPPPEPDPEEEPMLKTMTTPDGTVLLVDRLNYRIMPGTWAEVEAAIRAMIAAGTVQGEPDGSPKLWPITAAGVAALVPA